MNANQITIIIIEDDMIIASDISKYLRKVGYEILAIFPRAEAALPVIKQKKPDLLLVDVNLRGTMDGIAMVRQIRELKFSTGIIYLTANTDNPTFYRAKETQPHAFITKPFKKLDLTRAIDLAITRMAERANPQVSATNDSPITYHQQLSDRIFIRHQNHMIKICLDDISFIEAERNYCRIYTESDDYLMTLPLKTFEERLSIPRFMRIHRSFVANLLKIDRVDERGIYVIIGDRRLSVGPSYKKELLSRLTLI